MLESVSHADCDLSVLSACVKTRIVVQKVDVGEVFVCGAVRNRARLFRNVSVDGFALSAIVISGKVAIGVPAVIP